MSSAKPTGDEILARVRKRRDDQDEAADRADDVRQLKRRGKEQDDQAKLEEELANDERDKLAGEQRSGRFLQGKPKLDVVNDGAGFLLGLFVYAAALNFVRGGMPAMRGWFAAKFLNRPYSGPLENLTPAAPTGAVLPDAVMAAAAARGAGATRRRI